jgi:hypothetical protein
VFALLAEKVKSKVNPMDVAQWQFYVVPTSLLDATIGRNATIQLGQAQRLAAGAVRFEELQTSVSRAAEAGPRAAGPARTVATQGVDIPED